MNYSDQVKCYSCNGVKLRGQTLLLDTPKGRFRLCRDCYSEYTKGKLSDEYKLTKDNVKKLGADLDPYDLIKKKEQFVKDIKEGKWQNIL